MLTPDPDLPLRLRVVFSREARQRLGQDALQRLQSAFDGLANLIACCTPEDLDLPPALVTLKTSIDGLAVAYRVDRENRRLELIDVFEENAA